MVTEKGLSIIEIVFSIGVTVLVISGIVSLMVKSTGVKTDNAQRKKATEVAQIVIEDLVNKKKNDRDAFWELTPISNKKIEGYPDYPYTIGFTGVTTGDDCNDLAPWNCVNALISVNWGSSETIVVKRFFSKFY